jgi:peptidoglycan/LPS O-acetylase OafA/YrhL
MRRRLDYPVPPEEFEQLAPNRATAPSLSSEWTKFEKQVVVAIARRPASNSSRGGRYLSSMRQSRERMLGDSLPPHWESANLDFLRAIAVSLVFATHLGLTLGLQPPEEMGRFGVLIFFVHTSLVLMFSLERLELKGEPIFKSFYLRRFFRIYPLSVLWVGLIVILRLPRAPWWPRQNHSAGEILSNLLLIMNLFYVAPVTSVLWSLPYEIEMYLVLPILYRFGKRNGFRGLGVLWIGAAGIGLLQPRIAGRLDIAQYVPCFLAGIMSYFVGFKRIAPRIPWVAWPITIGAAASVFFGLELLGVGIEKGAWPACLLLGLTAPHFRELEWRPLRVVAAQIAKYSYGIYMTHLITMWISFVVIRAYPLGIKWIVFTAVSVALPVGLYHLVEAPMIKFGANLALRLKRVPEVLESQVVRGV